LHFVDSVGTVTRTDSLKAVQLIQEI